MKNYSALCFFVAVYLLPWILSWRMPSSPTLPLGGTPARALCDFLLKYCGSYEAVVIFPALLGAGLTALLIQLFLIRYTRDRKVGILGALLFLACPLVFVGTAAGGNDMLTLGFVLGAQLSFLPGVLAGGSAATRYGLLFFSGLMAALAVWSADSAILLLIYVPGVVFLIWERRGKTLCSPEIILLAVMEAAVVLCRRDFSSFAPVFDMGILSFAWGALLILLLGMLPVLIFLPCALGGWRSQRERLRHLPYFNYLLLVCAGNLFFSLLFIRWPLFGLAPLVLLLTVTFVGYLRDGNSGMLLRRVMMCGGVFVLLCAAAVFLRRFLHDGNCFSSNTCYISTMLLFVIWGLALLWSSRRNWKDQLTVYFTGLTLAAVAAVVGILT